MVMKLCTVEPLLRGHPDERPPPLERPLDNVNLNINVLISTHDERPPLLKGHFSGAKGVASQKGFHCIFIMFISKDCLTVWSGGHILFRNLHFQHQKSFIYVTKSFEKQT